MKINKKSTLLVFHVPELCSMVESLKFIFGQWYLFLANGGISKISRLSTSLHFLSFSGKVRTTHFLLKLPSDPIELRQYRNSALQHLIIFLLLTCSYLYVPLSDRYVHTFSMRGISHNSLSFISTIDPQTHKSPLVSWHLRQVKRFLSLQW